MWTCLFYVNHNLRQYIFSRYHCYYITASINQLQSYGTKKPSNASPLLRQSPITQVNNLRSEVKRLKEELSSCKENVKHLQVFTGVLVVYPCCVISMYNAIYVHLRYWVNRIQWIIANCIPSPSFWVIHNSILKLLVIKC